MEFATDGNSTNPEKKRIKNVKANMNATVIVLRGLNSIVGTGLTVWVLSISLFLKRERHRKRERVNGFEV